MTCEKNYSTAREIRAMSPSESFVFAGEVLLLFDGPPGILKRSNQSFDAFQPGNGMTAVTRLALAPKTDLTAKVSA